MTERYIQHDPNIASGLEPVKKFMKAYPLPEGMKIPVFAVVAEGDMIVVASAKVLPNPGKPGQSYTTTHFEMWRFEGMKVDEHWDGLKIGPPPTAQ
jgi:predicted SnoaL-like aldol condensation-catalyzing enzyme